MNTTFLYIFIGIALAYYLLTNFRGSGFRVSSGSILRMPKRKFPHQWKRILEDRIDFYKRLDFKEKTKFEGKLHVFLLNVRIVGRETDIDDLDRILVGASAIIPIFRFPNWHYLQLDEVHIYPDEFQIPETDKMAKGLTGFGAMEGKVFLSKKALHEGFADQNDQVNVGIHEFVHILDKQDGKMDGVFGKVMKEIDVMPWLHIIHNSIDNIHEGSSSIRTYGKVSQAEFLQ